MRNRVRMLLVTGVLSVVLLVGVAIGALSIQGSDAHAQSTQGATWQVKEFPMSTYGNASWGDFGAWVSTIPATCDVETVVVPATVTTGYGTTKKNINDASILAYYRCPSS